jgi:capsid protein
VDPKKDIEAEILAVNNLFKARSAVINEMGDDERETDARILSDQNREEDMELRRRGDAADEPAEPADPED